MRHTPPTPRAAGALPPEEARRARRLSLALGLLVTLTTMLIVLGALVRAHGAGLACPDWPLCFGEVIPPLDLRVAFEWSHRVVAGGVSLLFALLAAAVLRRPALRRRALPWIATAACLLALQVLLGALTVWHLLASWTVTSHLVVGNAFNATLLLTALRLREEGPPAAPAGAGLRWAVGFAALLLLFQIVLGGLVSSRYAGMACPEFPTCNGGVYFPAWKGAVGIHVHHRVNGAMLLAALLGAALLAGSRPRVAPLLWAALALACLQAAVGVANVLLGIPVEVTGLHSLGAALLVLVVAAAVRATFGSPRPARGRSPEETA